MADIINFLTLNLIQITGWRNTYIICGILGLCASLVGLIVISEPPNSVRLQIEAD
jgi:sugar phosphate permease